MKRREAHPYWLWEAMMGSPALLRSYLSGTEVDKVQSVVDEIFSRGIERFYLAGTGSSRFAGMVVRDAFRDIADVEAQVMNTMELGAYPPLELDEKSVVVFTSHSGDTPGDEQVIRQVQGSGAWTVGITNHEDSTLARTVDRVLSGPDTPMLRMRLTRSYPGNIFRGIQMAIEVAHRSRRSGKAESVEEKLNRIPDQLEKVMLDYEPRAKDIAERLLGHHAYLVIGSGPNLATAEEIALGFYQGTGVGSRPLLVEEFLHGSIQALTEHMAVVAVAAPGPLQGRILDAMYAVQRIGATTVLLAPEGTPNLADCTVPIPMPNDTLELLTPLTYMGPPWLIGYYFSILTGRDPDYMEMTDEAHQQALGLLMPAGSQFDRWSGRIP
ncbi:MAG: SIS domain-containing protein [Anaerolineales bacterium]|nr:SIS domain-containing protein [Anaerolineales bacterium]